jgi:hypothetical protein
MDQLTTVKQIRKWLVDEDIYFKAYGYNVDSEKQLNDQDAVNLYTRLVQFFVRAIDEKGNIIEGKV